MLDEKKAAKQQLTASICDLIAHTLKNNFEADNMGFFLVTFDTSDKNISAISSIGPDGTKALLETILEAYTNGEINTSLVQ